jgi:hypothetical protein
MATEDDVRRLCLSLPGVMERPSWSRPAWFARTMVARMWEDGVLTVKTGERDVLAGSAPDLYFWTPHHDRSPNLLLVRLAGVAEVELRDLLEESFRLAGSLTTSWAARLEPVG